jgi:hypothetical protein
MFYARVHDLLFLIADRLKETAKLLRQRKSSKGFKKSKGYFRETLRSCETGDSEKLTILFGTRCGNKDAQEKPDSKPR